MSYDIKFFGHCSEDGHDKVWGYVQVGDDQLYNFWGRRGGRFSFKKWEISEMPVYANAAASQVWYRQYYKNWEAPQFSELRAKAEEKCRSGRKSGSYSQVPVDRIESVVPNFFEEFEKQLTLAKLFNNFKGVKSDDWS